MQVTDALCGEHGVFYVWFDHLERVAASSPEQSVLTALTRPLAAALVSHAKLEDALLFGALEPRIGGAGPLAVMRDEHTRIEGALTTLLRGAHGPDGPGGLQGVLALAREHFRKEETVLFPLARQHLGAVVLDELGERWATARGVELGG